MLKCIKGHEIEILESCAGFYLGTLDPKDGLPFCRLTPYVWSEERVNELPLVRMFTDRGTVMCNGGCHCVTGEPFADIFKRV